MVSTKYPLKPTTNRLQSFLLGLYYLFEGIILFFIPETWRQKSISGQTVLITGGGSGIGQLMAREFSQAEVGKIILWDINEEGLKATKELIIKSCGNRKPPEIALFKVDLSQREQIYETAKKVKSQFGTVDILVNNAGVVSGTYFLDTPDELIQRTFDVNILAHFYTIKTFLPDMIKSGRGHLVNIASGAGNTGIIRLVDYCSSKAAAVGFDLALRLELAQADLERVIRTTIVKPYIIKTGMFAGTEPFLFPALEPEYVARRVIQAVRANTEEVILPWSIQIIFWIQAIIPSKAILPSADLFGVRDLMANFIGRKDS